ncbi:MAG TPA: glycosyltransferase family 2 protein [Polyangiaceae bacterium]|nr:glycosyltransferase family 2 protein [Polyangiaceae bacterium]
MEAREQPISVAPVSSKLEELAPGVSVIVPVYRSERTLPQLVELLAGVLPVLAPRHELILVNDGSPDGSWLVIEQLAKTHGFVRGISLMRNYGQHNATLCGVRAARYDICITMDDDLQHAPEDIHVLLDKLREGHDVVYGVWVERRRSWWRSLFATLSKRAVAWVMGANTVRDMSAFRAIRTQVRRGFRTFDGPDVLLDVLLSWGTSRFAAVALRERDRAAGHSNYTFWKLVKTSLLMLTSYTTAPLRFANFVGLCLTVFGVLAFGRVVYIYFIEGSIPGFSFLAATILLFGGVQLFALGIIGEYLARIFERASGRPPYSIGHTTTRE